MRPIGLKRPNYSRNKTYREIFPNNISRNMIQHRKCIRGDFDLHQNIVMDRSLSEPPQRNSPALFKKNQQLTLGEELLNKNHNVGKLNDIASGDPGMSLIEETENSMANETSSESSIIIDAEHHVNGDDIAQANENRMSGFMGNRNKKFRASTGELCFSQHLETDKSLFSEKNLETSSVSSLRRQSFNPSLYGSTTSLTSNNSRISHLGSPFYNGQTMYGGASAYSRRDVHFNSLRTPVQMRPSSRLSTASSSNNSLASDNNAALSNTAKRLLDVMSKFSSPINDARKLGNNLRDTTAAAIGHTQTLTQNRKRFDEEELHINQSIRISSPTTPYSRNSSSRNNNFKRELQVPTLTQLMKLKMQNNTEHVRTLAAASKSPLNRETEYNLPNLEVNKSNNENSIDNNRVHKNKIRNYVTKSRKKVGEETASVKEPNLPNVQFPELKSNTFIDFKLDNNVYTIDKEKRVESNWKNNVFSVAVPPPSGQLKTSSKNVAEPIEENLTYKFATPIVVASVDCNGHLSKNKFQFSDPFDPSKSIVTKLNFTNGSPTTNNKPDKLQPTNLNNASLHKPLKIGSVMDILKKDTLVNADKKTESFTNSVFENKDFGTKFKLSSNNWECTVCMIRNDKDKDKCVACETKRIDNVENASSTVSNSTPQLSNTKNKDTGFSNLVAQQNSKWECSACLTRNDNSNNKCLCCEQLNPNAMNKLVTPKLDATDKPPLLKTTDTDFKALLSVQNAKWECSACMTRNESSKSRCVCCDQSKPGSTCASTEGSGFSFGVKTNKFTFGVPAVKTSGTSSAQTTSSMNDNKESAQPTGFIFGNKSSTDTVPQSAFAFGMPAKQQNENKSIAEKTCGGTNAVVFGSKINTFGDQNIPNEGTKTKNVSFSVEKKGIITPDISSTTSPSSEVPKSFIFGQAKPAASIPSFAALDKTKTFSFDDRITSAPKVVTPQTEETKTVSADFIFGNAQKDKPSSISLTFGSNNSEASKSSTFQFGSSPSLSNSSVNLCFTEAKNKAFSFGADKSIVVTSDNNSQQSKMVQPPVYSNNITNKLSTSSSSVITPGVSPTSTFLPSSSSTFTFGSNNLSNGGEQIKSIGKDNKPAEFVFGSNNLQTKTGGTTSTLLSGGNSSVNFSFGSLANSPAVSSENSTSINSFKLVNNSDKPKVPLFGSNSINFGQTNPVLESKSFEFKSSSAAPFTFSGEVQTPPNVGLGCVDISLANSNASAGFTKNVFPNTPVTTNSISMPTASAFQFGNSSGSGLGNNVQQNSVIF